MIEDDSLYDGEAQPGSVGFRREVGIEGLIEVLFFDSLARVLDLNSTVLGIPLFDKVGT